MEVLLILVEGLVNWVTEHWFLTFLILVSLEGVHFHFDGSSKMKDPNIEIIERNSNIPPEKSIQIPDGYLLCNGSTFDEPKYPVECATDLSCKDYMEDRRKS